MAALSFWQNGSYGLICFSRTPVPVQQHGPMNANPMLQHLLWKIVWFPYQPASDLYGFSPKALDSLGHRVIAIQQIVLISFPCGKDVDVDEVVLVSEPIPIAQRYSDIIESHLIVRIDWPFALPSTTSRLGGLYLPWPGNGSPSNIARTSMDS